jgi:hypothetical protein
MLQKAGRVPGLVWTCEEILTHIGFLTPKLSSNSDSLYLLNCPGPLRSSKGEEILEHVNKYHGGSGPGLEREICPLLLLRCCKSGSIRTRRNWIRG